MTPGDFRGRLESVRQSLLAIEAEILELDPPTDVLREFHSAVDQVRTSVWAAVASNRQGARQVVAQVRLERTVSMCQQALTDLDSGVLDPKTAVFGEFGAQIALTMDRISETYAAHHIK